ncbi:MAG: tRNA threonylcarbamoyladenosine dehydratase [Firmicutes bacterium]|nr:tRNA threonylcarbamoyladenosine dehydratase [Bacillota bacterium]
MNQQQPETYVPDETDAFCRSRILLGETVLRRLQAARVCVCGLGGVGSYVAEALARGGVGHIRLIDCDVVAASNINRQLCALTSSVGRLKTAVVAERLAQIHPQTEIERQEVFIRPENAAGLIAGCDYVLDAIDFLPGKIGLIAESGKSSIPIVSAMGAANRLHPEKLRLADISQTHTCPLARVMRRELKKQGIVKGVPVVFSEEIPQKTGGDGAPLGSVSFVPGAMGLIMAGKAIRDIGGIED